jgi:hypothetical protein
MYKCPPIPPRKHSLGGGGWFRPRLDHPPSRRERERNNTVSPLGWPLGRTRSRRGRSGAEWESNAVTGSSWHEVAAFDGAPRRGVEKLQVAIPARPAAIGRVRFYCSRGGPTPGSRPFRTESRSGTEGVQTSERANVGHWLRALLLYHEPPRNTRR